MFSFWLHTLETLRDKVADNPEFATEHARLERMCSDYQVDPAVAKMQKQLNKLFPSDTYDPQVILSAEDKLWLDSLVIRLTYPSCQICRNTESSTPVCQCNRFQREYETYLIAQLDEWERRLEELIAATFRPKRNGYGGGLGAFGIMNIILTYGLPLIGIPPLGFASTCLALASPTLAGGGWIGYRAVNDARLQYADHQAELFEKKVKLLFKHKKTTQIRQKKGSAIPVNESKDSYTAPVAQNMTQITSVEPMAPLYPTMTISPQPLPKVKKRRIRHTKEKKLDGGNPIGHAVMGGGATLAVSLAFIKWGVFATVMSLGPIAWGVALGVTVCAGLYFAYLRNKQILCEAKHQNAGHVLDGVSEDLDSIHDAAKKGQVITLDKLEKAKAEVKQEQAMTQTPAEKSKMSIASVQSVLFARPHRVVKSRAIAEKVEDEIAKLRPIAQTIQDSSKDVSRERDQHASTVLARQTTIKSASLTQRHAEQDQDLDMRFQLQAV